MRPSNITFGTLLLSLVAVLGLLCGSVPARAENPAAAVAASGDERAGMLLMLLALGARATASNTSDPAPSAGPLPEDGTGHERANGGSIENDITGPENGNGKKGTDDFTPFGNGFPSPR
ncbi:MAG: hypothetical protein R3C97_01185 [Geminicoccaceae bacterium]